MVDAVATNQSIMGWWAEESQDLPPPSKRPSVANKSYSLRKTPQWVDV